MARAFVRASSEKISYPNLAAIGGAGKVAVSFWIYPTGSSSYDAIFGQLGAASGAGSSHGFLIQHQLASGTDLQVNFRSGGYSGAYHIFSNKLTLNTWQHVLVQYDSAEAASGDRVKLYVNGTVQAHAAHSAIVGNVGTTNQPLLLGSTGTTNYWSGNLAEAAIWTGVVLDSTQRTNLATNKYAANDASLSSGLVFYAPLDSAGTAGVNDLIGPYTGTATGTSVVSHPSGVPAATVQLAYPASDIAAGSWTSTGANLYSVLEDDSDASYIRSSSGAGSDVATVALDPLSLPQAGTVTLRIRHRAV